MMMTMTRNISKLVLLSCVALAPQAWAAPRVIVPPTAADAGAFEKPLLQSLQSQLASDGRVEVVDSQAVDAYLRDLEKSDYVTPPDPQAEKAADDLLAAGWRDFKNLRLPDAIDKLERAKLTFRQLPQTLRSNKKLLTAHLHLGIAYITSGEKTRGEQEIRDMLTLDGARFNRTLNKKYYAPEIIAIFDKIKKDVLEHATSQLTIQAEPANAQVLVDGMPVNGALVRNLPEGEHFVAASASGWRDFATSKFIVAGDNQISIKLERNLPNDISAYFIPIRSAYDLPQEAVGFLDNLCVKLDGAIVLFLKVNNDAKGAPESLQGQLYDQRSQETSSIESAALKSPAEVGNASKQLLKALLAQIDSRGYVVSKTLQQTDPKTAGGNAIEESPTYDPTATRAAPPRENPWYKKWWVYGVVGGAALAVVGGVLLFSGSSSSGSTLLIDNPNN